MKPLVLYHANCWDGFCAAWVARRFLGDIEAIPVHYGQRPPDVTDRDVYILDFSYPPEVMAHIFTEARSLRVIDHHKTAEWIREYPWATFWLQKSGARLTWEYFYRDKPVPWLVAYTEDRDLWRHVLLYSKEINAALRSYPLDFNTWDIFVHLGDSGETWLLDEMRDEGVAIRRAEKQIIDASVRNAWVSQRFGKPIRVVNATTLFSEVAGTLAEGYPFGACYFDRPDGKRQWSLRSTEEGADVSEIAKTHGGGGHQHAAGFEEPVTLP